MKRLTEEQSIIISAYTGILAGDCFSGMHEYIEKLLGQPVFTHQLGDKDLAKKIQELSKQDFLDICYARDGDE